MLIKIIVNLTTGNGEHTIVLPQTQNEFDESLTSMMILTGDRSEYEINYAKSNLDGINYSIGFAKDIEELNFLAQLLDGFFDNELKALEAVVIHEDGVVTMKQLINIACHLFDYEIDHSIKSFHDLGLSYIREKMPDSDICIVENLDLSGVGIAVQSSQQGEFTSLGYISNYHYMDFENTYDGHFFPEYDYDENYILKVRLSKDDSGKGVEFTIPASQNVVNRALHRLGVSSLDECIITRYSSWDFDAITESLWMGDSIEELNELVNKISRISKNEINNYLEAVKEEESIISIALLDLFTDFYLLYDFKKRRTGVIKFDNEQKTFRLYSEEFKKLKELLRHKALH